MKIMLPIKSKYMDLIFENKKMYEFRKTKPKEKIDTIIFYVTSPIMKVVGEASVENIIEGSNEYVWNATNKYGGLDKKVFDEYFLGSKKCIAYKLSDVKKYNVAKELMDYDIKYVPQSFVYIREEENDGK